MKKLNMVAMLFAAAALAWTQKRHGSLVERFMTSFNLDEDDAIRALAWTRTQLHNLLVAPKDHSSRESLSHAEWKSLGHLANVLDSEPAVYMWLPDEVADALPERAEFPLSEKLGQLANTLCPAPRAGLPRDRQHRRAVWSAVLGAMQRSNIEALGKELGIQVKIEPARERGTSRRNPSRAAICKTSSLRGGRARLPGTKAALAHAN